MTGCERSFNVGWWRGRAGKPSLVRLAPGICRDGYVRGHHAGRHARTLAEIFERVMDDPDPLFFGFDEDEE